MVQVMMIAGTISMFVAGFAAWYSMWHRRAASYFEAVPVRKGRPVYVLRRDVSVDDSIRRP
jgi:hypothetical protein